ncbi:MAG: anti-sigma factor domain-containing protein [Gemmatimonadaceae bacterium]
MTADTWRETAAAYALDALDAREVGEFEAWLRTSPEAQREVAELREVAALLAFAAPRETPPASLRDTVLASARVERPLAARRPTEQRPKARALGVAPWLALAASVVAMLVLFGRYEREVAQRSLAAGTADSLRRVLASQDQMIAALLAPDVESMKLVSAGAPPSARLYWNRATGEIVLAAFALPPAAQGRTYQLWGIPSAGAPVSLGTFNTMPNGAGRHIARAPAGLAIAVAAVTEEPSSGSPQPTTQPFLVSQTN